LIHGFDGGFNSANVINGVYERLLGQVNPRCVPLLIRTMEAFLHSTPNEFIQFLLESGKLAVMLRACLASTPDLAQSLQDYSEADISVVSYMAVCARVCLINPAALQQACIDMVTKDGTVS
jgi:hypothetical protein